MATFVVLAGILFFLQRVWSSFLARLWKSMLTSKRFKTSCFDICKRESDLIEFNGWAGDSEGEIPRSGEVGVYLKVTEGGRRGNRR